MSQSTVESMADRYVYDVVRHLPQYQRDDISRELHSLIDDMLEAQSGDSPTEQDLNEVLVQLGEPKKLAEQYRDKKRYLIGPACFDQYVAILKIVLPCVLFGITIATFLDAGLAREQNYVTVFARYLAAVLSALFQGFIWVTVIFALVEYNMEKSPQKSAAQKEWSPADLPQIPSEQAVIPKSEPIAGIVFTILVIILFNCVPQLLGVYSAKNGFSPIPIFDIRVLSTMMPLFNLCFAAGGIKEVIKLLLGKYSVKLAVIALILNAVTLCVTIFIFSNGAIWNPNFLQSLSAVQMLPTAENLDFTSLWNNLSRLFLAVVAFATVLDSGVLLYKGWKADRT